MMRYMTEVDIVHHGGTMFDVNINRTYGGVGVDKSKHEGVTRSSLIRAQRMQLKLFDEMKGQSPDE